MRRARTKNPTRKRPHRAPKLPPSILILRLDSEKLTRDGLTLGDEIAFASQLSKLCLGSRVVTINATTDSDLVARLRSVAEDRKRFDLIVVVAHSNESIICHASDGRRQWPEFAKYLEPFAPRQLALIACAAGGPVIAKQLFSTLPRLDRIYASPECVNINLANLILLVAGYSLLGRNSTGGLIPWVKLASLFGTGRRLKVWRRHGAPSGQEIFENILAWASR